MKKKIIIEQRIYKHKDVIVYNTPSNLDNCTGVWRKSCTFAAENLKKMGRMSRFTNAFKAKVAIEAIKETATVPELAKR